MSKQTIPASKPLPEQGRTRLLSQPEVVAIRKLGFSASNQSVVMSDGTVSTGRGRIHPAVKIGAQPETH